jgi:NAD(P)-dependent dehydrogenase (short-subunit alcohol dehydrogenase family)
VKSVLITGASSGFGQRAALDLAAEGWRVFASMRDTQRGAELMDAAKSAGTDGTISLVALDVTDANSVENGVRQVLEATGGTLDALLNNAGYSALGAFEDLPDVECRRQMETNFFGALAVTRAVLPAMRKAGHGRIVVVTSNAVNTPHPMLSMYAASKWALEGWAEALAMEVAPFGVEVVLVQPGAHRTPFATHVVPFMPEDSAYRPWMEAAMPGLSNLDRWGRDPAKAAGPIAAAVSAEQIPFRTSVGEDSVAFSCLKGALPFEARAWAVRAIVGMPAPGAFAKTDGARAQGEQHGVQAEIAKRLADAIESEPAILDLAIALTASSDTAVR